MPDRATASPPMRRVIRSIASATDGGGAASRGSANIPMIRARVRDSSAPGIWTATTPPSVPAMAALASRGYRVIGPTLRDAAIVLDDIDGIADLPAGWTDVQDGGSYRVQRRADDALFGYAVGPHSWKNFLHPSRLRLWRAEKNG